MAINRICGVFVDLEAAKRAHIKVSLAPGDFFSDDRAMKTIIALFVLFAISNAHALQTCRGAYFDGKSFTQDGAIYIQLGNLPLNQTVKVPGVQREVALSTASDTLQLSLGDGTKVLGLSRVSNHGIHGENTIIDLEILIEGVWERVEAYCPYTPESHVIK